MSCMIYKHRDSGMVTWSTANEVLRSSTGSGEAEGVSLLHRLTVSRHGDNMKTPPVSLLLGVCVLLSGQTVSAVSLNVSPNLQQFFIEDSVSLSCIGGGQTGGQTVGQTGGQTVKRTSGGQTGDCGSGFGTSDGSSCRVSGLSQSDSGVYWCETSSGETSLQVNISVTLKDGPFILEIPALPVMTGSDVTLRCRNKDGSTRAAYFLKNGIHTGDRVKVQELSISRVQESDEGFYSCSTDLFGPSPQSWLRVRAPPPPPSVSVSRLLCHLVAVCPYCVCTVLMVSMCCSRKTGRRPAVSMEMTLCVEEYDDLTADVITEREL
ncbi:uncharacterized protein LOC130164322 isoform X1 [Seriola aureovittata]|uniref:uncharacterized protein LOC130164322 isoform X1 n=2 Tax=Seriola aureovittata TaxID=2871759 RepID=UPI0024BE747E|nr:uncharacterized protein LOC130164322 isoform X1 [Seriola aureovittata]